MNDSIIHLIVSLVVFGVCFYSVLALRLEQFFRKNSTAQIQLFYLLISMALAYLVCQFLFSLQINTNMPW